MVMVDNIVVEWTSYRAVYRSVERQVLVLVLVLEQEQKQE